jgi:hypothetical protein
LLNNLLPGMHLQEKNISIAANRLTMPKMNISLTTIIE